MECNTKLLRDSFHQYTALLYKSLTNIRLLKAANSIFVPKLSLSLGLRVFTVQYPYMQEQAK